MGALLGLADLQAARERIGGRIHRTPALSSTQLGRLLGVRLHFKAELFQKTGSFKVRGVFNKLDGLSDDEKRRGLVSMSAGNHAAALAYAASVEGLAATIVMPVGAPPSKIAATRGYGGEVLLTDGNLMEACESIQRDRGMTLVHPFDDLRIMAGHGSVGLEVLEDLPDLDLLIVPVGGGGLIGGTAAAVKALRPRVKVIGVEPVGLDAMTRALAAGKPVPIERIPTVADGLSAPFAGAHPLRHVQAFVDDVVLVSEEAIVRALRLIVTRCKLGAEPSGAAGLAALLEGKIDLSGVASVACVISGGNVDPATLGRLLGHSPG